MVEDLLKPSPESDPLSETLTEEKKLLEDNVDDAVKSQINPNIVTEEESESEDLIEIPSELCPESDLLSQSPPVLSSEQSDSLSDTLTEEDNAEEDNSDTSPKRVAEESESEDEKPLEDSDEKVSQISESEEEKTSEKKSLKKENDADSVKADSDTKIAETYNVNGSSEIRGGRKKGRPREFKGLEAAKVPELSDGLDWLPKGWLFESRPRNSGTKMVDRYYYSPDNRQFRSKTEVMYFLENGVRKSASKVVSKNTDTSDNNMHMEGVERSKENGRTSNKKKNKKRKILKFDFNNPPEKVEWVSEPGLEGRLTPLIGGDNVPEPSKLEWAEGLVSLKAGI